MIGKYLFGMLVLYCVAILCCTLVDQTWLDQIGLLGLGNNWLNFNTFMANLGTIGKVLTWDLPLFKNVDGTANDLWVVRLVLILITSVFWINLGLFIIQSIAGIASKMFGGAK